MNHLTPSQGKTVYEKDSVCGKMLMSKPETDVVHMELDPGKSLPVHTTPVEVFFYVLQGTVQIEIGEEEITADADTLVESPKDIPHGLHNPGIEPCRLLVVKTPRPEK